MDPRPTLAGTAPRATSPTTWAELLPLPHGLASAPHASWAGAAGLAPLNPASGPFFSLSLATLLSRPVHPWQRTNEGRTNRCSVTYKTSMARIQEQVARPLL
jgi:hypothetical protein